MDIQFIQFNDALPLSSVSETTLAGYRAVQIAGPDFRTAVEVEINGIASPSFVVASSKLILAQVPGMLGDAPVSSVTVVSSNFRFTKQSLVTFKLGTEPKKATGLLCLMQTYIKLLLTSTFFDAFMPGLGGGALNALGTNADSVLGPNVVAVITRGVNTAADQMRALQARQVGLSDDEKLLSANLLSCQYRADITGIDARIELIAQSGVSAVASLEL